MAQGGHLLFVDAHDSFAANIIALLQRVTSAEITTIDIDYDHERGSHLLSQHGRPTTLEVSLQCFDAIIIGPGPGHPQNPKDIGILPDVWRCAEEHKIPVLGICLGFQFLCCAYGLPVVRLSVPCHGQVKQILHEDEDIFDGSGNVLATQYNSLGVRDPFWKSPDDEEYLESALSTPSDFSTTSTARTSLSLDVDLSKQLLQSASPLHRLAWDDDGFLMAVKHNTLPFWGLQFHPESCRSNAECTVVLQNWWRAVSDWNKQHRDRRSHQITQAAEATTYMLQPRDDAQASLGRYLLHLSESSGAKVQSRTVKIKCHLDQVCEILRDPVHGHLVDFNPSRLAMLESTKKGRYSIYALQSRSCWQIEYHHGQCYVSQSSGSPRCFSLSVSSAFECLEVLVHHKKAHGGCDHIPFWGGLIGFCSYEGGLEAAGFSAAASPSTSTPDLSFLWTDRSIVIDKVKRVAHVQSLRQSAFGHDRDWIDTVSTLLESHTPPLPDLQVAARWSPDMTTIKISLPDEAEYKSKIRACQTELHLGNSYELCLTAEAIIKVPHSPREHWSLYHNLRTHNPVPYAAFLHLGRTRILSSSPEQYLTWSRTGTIDMVPMKGTVQRTPTTTLADAQLILSSPKESAENLMIADLIRHDLHNVVGTTPASSVTVLKLCEVVEHETVYQLVSHIQAKPPIPPPSLTPSEVQDRAIHYGHTALRTTLPPGSMTGAPKRRSCAILSSLESRPRGVYSGVLGYMDVGGGGAFSVCIRTAFSIQDEDQVGEDDKGVVQETWRVGAGGAITVLSQVDDEWDEMRGKLESVLAAFRMDSFC